MDTKQRILVKADELFMRYGIRSVSMDDIAMELGMSKKTLYQYCSDKDELVDAVINITIERNKNDCEHGCSISENAIDEVFIAMEMVEEMFKNMNPSILFDMQKYHPKAYASFLKHKNDYLYRIILTNLRRGIAEELYRSDINVELIASFRIESMMLPFYPEFFGKKKFDLAHAEQEILLHYVFGVASMKGYKLILKYQQERLKKTVSNAKIK